MNYFLNLLAVTAMLPFLNSAYAWLVRIPFSYSYAKNPGISYIYLSMYGPGFCYTPPCFKSILMSRRLTSYVETYG